MIDITITLSGRRYVVLVGLFTHLTATSRDSAYHTAFEIQRAINQNTSNQARVVDKTKNPEIVY